MADIALSVGAKYFSEATGDDLSLITMADLGHAKKVVVSRDQTIIVRDDNRSEEVEARVLELRDAEAIATSKSDKDFIKERIASLSGGVGVVYAGGNSDIEQKELYDRIDDAVCAVRSALEEGILPGGGTSLLYESINLGDSLAESILKAGFVSPFNQILENSGKDYKIDKVEFGKGFNIKTGEYGDMYKMGVIDPAKVTKNALRNAVSVATTILTTNAIVTLKR